MKKVLISVFIFILVVAIAMTGYMFYEQNNGKSQEKKQVTNEETNEEIIEPIIEPEPIDYGYIPLGQWGIASKYSTKDQKYEDVYVGVEKVCRGVDAETIINEYMEENEYLTYKDPQEGMEWLVVEYVIFFGDYAMNQNGANSDIKTRIKGYGDNENIVIGNKTYEITTQDISDRDYTKNERIVGRFAAQIPIECKEFVVVFGDENHTQCEVEYKVD